MSPAEPSLDLLCLGEPLIELNQTDPAVERFALGHGGDTSNCAIAAARQGLRVGYASRLGKDRFGRSLRALWTREGVDASAVIEDPSAPTGLYFVTHDEHGHAFAYYRRGSAASLLRPGEIPSQTFASARVLHVSAISQAISDTACDAAFEAMAVAREAGRTVCYDTNLRLALWPLARARAVIHEAARHADILRPSIDDAQQLLGIEDADAIVDRYLAMGPTVVALTLGREGALVATPERRQRFPALEVEAVDATGAGDAFDGAFIAAWVRTGDPLAAGRWATAAAALATTGYGAVAALPRWDEVERLLARGVTP